jgi:hypothetical protein
MARRHRPRAHGLAPGLIAAALSGTLSTDIVESGPFTSLEQAMLPQAAEGRDPMNASPSAMISTGPWRSAKCDGCSCQPVDPLSGAEVGADERVDPEP